MARFRARTVAISPIKLAYGSLRIQIPSHALFVSLNDKKNTALAGKLQTLSIQGLRICRPMLPRGAQLVFTFVCCRIRTAGKHTCSY
jgi:hypothetical protein